MTFDRLDVVVVPFPFADKGQGVRRPALVLSSAREFGDVAGHSVMAMITSAEHRPWPLDVPISDLTMTGLSSPSVVRMKLFTLDHRFVLGKKGRLAPSDGASVQRALASMLGLGWQPELPVPPLT